MIDVERILERWRLRPTGVTRAALGTMSQTLLVETVTGRVVLRGHRQPDERSVGFELDVMEAARDAEVPVPAIIATASGDRLVMADGRWWSLQEWVDGEQPPRGSHTTEQAAAMGGMLATVHVGLEAVDAAVAPSGAPDETADFGERATQLIALIQERPVRGDDDEAALNWIRAQRRRVGEDRGAEPPPATDTQVVHGDYHDANLIFRGSAVAAVLDWERARLASPGEECVRAMHLSFRLEPQRCAEFLGAYRRRRDLTADALDDAAARYGYHRDRSLWMFEELYRDGNERLRPLLNRQPFVPFQDSWVALRQRLPG